MTGLSRPRENQSNSGILDNIKGIKHTFGDKELKKLTLMTAVFALCFLGAVAHAQQLDFGFGFSTTSAAGPSTSNGLLFPSEKGGGYPSFSADFLLKHRIGVEGEVSWRGHQNLYGGNQPYRPLFWAFNAIWAPKLSKNFTAEVLGGIGGEDLRFYGITSCSYAFYCTNYASSNHFMGDFGGGLRAYVWHDVFIRPEVRVYLINNNQEFSSNHVARYGATLGYSFGR